MSLTLGSSTSSYWIRPVGLTAAALGAQNSTGAGFTMSCWVRVNASLSALGSNFCCIAGLSNPTTDAYMGTFVDDGNDIFVTSICDGFTSGQYAQQGQFAQGSWCLVMMQFPNSGGQNYYATVNNEALATNTTANNNATTLTNLCVGFQPPGNGFGGTNTATNLINVAELCVWRGMLGLGEYRMLNSGANPLTVRRDILQWYFPLRGDLQDYGHQKIALQPQGTVATLFADHPSVQAMPRRLLKAATNYASTYYANLAY